MRAAPLGLGARHRGVDSEPPRHVVRGRHDPAPVRIAADDERPRPEPRLLELLHGGEEGVEIEVRDDHTRSVVPERMFGRRTRRSGPPG